MARKVSVKMVVHRWHEPPGYVVAMYDRLNGGIMSTHGIVKHYGPPTIQLCIKSVSNVLEVYGIGWTGNMQYTPSDRDCFEFQSWDIHDFRGYVVTDAEGNMTLKMPDESEAFDAEL